MTSSADLEKIAVITGASSGIGRSVAEALYPSHSVVLIGRRSEVLNDFAAALGRRAFVVTADLTVQADVEAAAGALKERYATVDALVNCVGARPIPLLTTMSLDQIAAAWRQEVAVNLTSAVLISYAVAPLLRRPGGRVVHIGSIAADSGGRNPGSAGYAAAKAGLQALSMGLSRELAPQGITVNTVSPGFVAGTGITDSWTPGLTESLVADTPAGRPGYPSDVASIIGFLLSESAGFITGQCIRVDGGMS
jgi:3-oxoacyl-[acyl-carrier protein] reductase